MIVVVTGDTHIGPRRRGPLPAELLNACAEADQILHTGDATELGLLVELAALAPLDAVTGNCDGFDILDRYGESRTLELAGVPLAMIHDGTGEHGRRSRLMARFPGCRVVIFGHSHAPVCDDREGVLLVNPGSPTDRRRAPRPSYGVLELAAGEIVQARVIEL